MLELKPDRARHVAVGLGREIDVVGVIDPVAVAAEVDVEVERSVPAGCRRRVAQVVVIAGNSRGEPAAVERRRVVGIEEEPAALNSNDGGCRLALYIGFDCRCIRVEARLFVNGLTGSLPNPVMPNDPVVGILERNAPQEEDQALVTLEDVRRRPSRRCR